MKITGEKMRLVSLACSFKLQLQTTYVMSYWGAIASQDASMNDCIFMQYSLCIVLVNDSFASHVFIFGYALQVVLYGK
jgi:hypothetical protein